MFKTIFHPNHAKGGGVNIDLPQLQSIRRTVYIKLKHSLRLLVFCQNLLIFQNDNFTKSTGICDLWKIDSENGPARCDIILCLVSLL